jgi:hypothetical protein
VVKNIEIIKTNPIKIYTIKINMIQTSAPGKNLFCQRGGRFTNSVERMKRKA